MSQKAIVKVTAALAIMAAAPAQLFAADLYRPDAGPASFKDAPLPGWAGFYLGGHLGAAWTSDKVTDLDGYGFFSSLSNDAKGLLGGGQAGYNWQRGNAVFGLEADFGTMDIDHTKTDRLKANFKENYYGDVTGRLGYAFGPALLYAKGGFAYLSGEANVLNDDNEHTSAKFFTGWTAGGGLEYALNPNWSVKGEYLHFDFGPEISTVHGCCKGSNTWYPFRYEHKLTAETAKLGVNYHLTHEYEALK